MNSQSQAGTGTRRRQQKLQTRALILDTARALFEARGFDGTTMRAVAAEAGVGLGTIFSHFDDKGALLIAALLEDLAETDLEILETLPTESPFREQILHVAAAGYAYWCRRPALSATLLRELWFIRGPAAQQRRTETAGFIDFVARLVEGAQRRGEIRSGIDPRPVAEILYTFYVGNLIRAAGDDRLAVEDLLQATESFVDILITGIGPVGA